MSTFFKSIFYIILFLFISLVILINIAVYDYTLLPEAVSGRLMIAGMQVFAYFPSLAQGLTYLIFVSPKQKAT